MTLKSNTAEGGTNTATITTGNSGGGSGDAFNAVTINSPSTFTFDNSQTMHGGLSLKVGTSSGVTTFFDWTGYTATSMAVRYYYRVAALPSLAGVRVVDVRDSAGLGVGRVLCSATNKLVYQNNGSTLFTSVNSLSANTWYRIELVCCNNTGQYRFDYYLGDNTTPVETGFANASQASGTTNTIAVVRFGNSASVAWTGTEWYDDVAANDGATTYIGVSSVPASVTGVAATATADMVVPAITGETIVSGGGAASASAQMIAPAVSGVRSPTVADVAATSTALFVPPAVSTVRSPTVIDVAAVATAQAIAPVVTAVRSPVVTSVVATATATPQAPVVVGSGSVNVGPTVAAVATALLRPPAVTGVRNATVTAVAATSTSLLRPPGVASNAGVIVVRSSATTLFLPPTIPGGSTVIAVAAHATALVKAPGVTTYVPRDVDLKIATSVYGHPFDAKLTN